MMPEALALEICEVEIKGLRRGRRGHGSRSSGGMGGGRGGGGK